MKTFAEGLEMSTKTNSIDELHVYLHICLQRMLFFTYIATPTVCFIYPYDKVYRLFGGIMSSGKTG